MFNFHSKKAEEEEEEEDYLQFKPYRTFFSKVYLVINEKRVGFQSVQSIANY